MVDTRASRLILVVAIIAGAMLNMVLFLAILWQLGPSSYDPFGDFPVQTVITPVVHIGDEVQVQTIKCYKEDVVVKGAVQWRATSPFSAVFNSELGTAERSKGCYEAIYYNAMPEDVEQFVRRWLNANQTVTLNIEGWEEPVQGGVTKRWTTTSFEVVP